MERKTIWLAGVLTLLLLLAGLGTSFAGVDKTGSVPATATLGASTSLTVQAKTIVGNTDVASINFGSLPGGTTNMYARQYVAAEVASNYGGWELEIYTDNFATQPSTTTWRFQYGGMKGATAGNRAPMVWQAYRSTHTVADPPANLVGWTYLKDKKDVDDPGSPGDQSWTRAHMDGYTNIAYGGPDYVMVVEPTGGVLDTDKKLMVYLGGLFGSAAADTYGTTLGIDLYHE
jgi:hypothetical protein